MNTTYLESPSFLIKEGVGLFWSLPRRKGLKFCSSIESGFKKGYHLIRGIFLPVVLLSMKNQFYIYIYIYISFSNLMNFFILTNLLFHVSFCMLCPFNTVSINILWVNLIESNRQICHLYKAMVFLKKGIMDLQCIQWA